jgi:Kdo2-lipid IVA lauroyltransferase/acyltransferase
MQLLGRFVGRVVAILPLRECQVAKRNVQLCFPELPAPAQRQLARAAVIQTVQSLCELPWIWTRRSADLLQKIDAVHGHEHLAQALASGRGTIIAAPHFGAWELLNRWLAEQTPMSVLYRAPKSAWLEPLLVQCRARPQISLLRAEPAAVRTLLKQLQAGKVIAILPDQQPKVGEGEFADFFNIPAMTMTLLPKLAQRTGAVVLFCSAQRLASGHFTIRIEATDPEVTDAAALNANVERIARRDPSQYQLTYKRFSMRPEGVGKRYE